MEDDPQLLEDLQTWMRNSSPLAPTKAVGGDDDILVPLATVKEIVGLGKTKIYDLMKRGQFPPAYKPGGAATRWNLREVRAWRANLQRLRRPL
ncbi:AlpA family phage regulatory protein [Sphingobium yanoikuyae]|uniref:helix-turn-helix transcriptional regulator n=1 Tax=Sphingobium yanoikuyae TaxID=13690 RepID=UPI001F1838B1|nr:AlpA family phage regulatory protein [Sphingobium yanoikuyae]MDG2511073.1 AlpA family phage regulatory protein [Sphingobium yanoikuyae]